MLREPQHERKLLNDIKTPPLVLSAVEGLRLSSLAACSWQLNLGLTRNSKPETQPISAQDATDIIIYKLVKVKR